MKKLLGKMAILGLSATIALTSVGCGQIGGLDDAGENVVQMYVWESGYGIEWINELVEEYNAMADNPYSVELYSSTNMTTVTSTLSSGADVNPYDLYITGLGSFIGTVPDMEDLSTVLDSTKYATNGETIRSKYDAQLIESRTYNGKFLGFNLGSSPSGIFYNAQMFDTYGLKVPNTSEELRKLVIRIGADSRMKTDEGEQVAPFAHFKDANNGYWKYIYEPWVAQAMGTEAFGKLILLEDAQGNKDQKAVYLGNKETDARYQVIKELGKFLNANNVHKSSNSLGHTNMQTLFVSGEAAMMVNGAWIKNEVASSGQSVANFKIMKTPVFSGIINRLNSIANDEELSKVVAAADAGKTLEQAKVDVPALTQADYDEVILARGMTYGAIGDAGQIVFVPNYSGSKDAAKDFLSYIYSDAGAQAWMDALHTDFAIELVDKSLVDTTGWDAFDKSMNEFGASTFSTGGGLNSSKVYVDNGKDIFANVNIIMNLTLSSGAKTVDEIWDDMQTSINNGWDLWIGSNN